MRIRTKALLASGTALAAIAMLATVLAWSELQRQDANRQRQIANEILLGLSQLRMVTFEYGLERLERARVQWHLVSTRLDGVIDASEFSDTQAAQAIADLRQRRATARRVFSDLSAPLDSSSDETSRRFASQLLGRLLIGQQESIVNAARLSELASARIASLERQVRAAALAGLALVAVIGGGVWWFFQRVVLAPIMRLQQAAAEVATGNWHLAPGADGARNDEIGDLWRNFDAMVQSLRSTFTSLERSNGALAAMNRDMEAFNYSVAHDLRTPLRALDGFSHMLLQDYGQGLDAEGRDALARIRAASQRMGALIDDLLRLSQATRAQTHIAPVDLGAMARQIAASLEKEAPGRGVEWSIEDMQAPAADPALMRVAMQNLLQNAWKFTGRTARPAIRVGAIERDGVRAYFVADNGVGFDMAHAQRLFSAFQRLHSTSDFPGTGIGLALVQRIIHRHGGRVWAEARPGEGATFFFTLGGAGASPANVPP